jgi:hypothetical protein
MISKQLEFYPPPDKAKRPDIPLVASTFVPQKWTNTLPNKFIATLVTRVSQTNLQTWVDDLSAFHTRHTKSPYIHQVTDWLVKQFKSLGYTDVVKHPYSHSGYQLNNVVCTKAGIGNTGKMTIVCGHYDCIMENSGDATARAPGADDNAAGIAVLLELARILSQVQLQDDVQFVAFSGEEQGLWGSSAYAQYVQDNNINIHLLINLDQIGYPMGDNSGIVVEYDMNNQVTENDAASKQYAEFMAQMAADYCSVPVTYGPIYSSDYMPFEARGYVVIGIYEGEGNPNYHNDSDIPSTVNFACAADVTRMTLATVLHETAALVDDSSSGIDLYIRDSDADTGIQPSNLPHWTSPDIWVRNSPPPSDPNDPNDPNFGENPDDGHQNPINNFPNYLYVNVWNRGFQVAPANTFTVKAFRCNPGTGMLWPNDFVLLGQLTITEPIPANGGKVRIGPFSWTPQIKDHECLLAIVSGEGDHAVPDIYSGQLEHSLLVRFDNNVGQRNVSPQPSVLGGNTKTTFYVHGTTHSSTNHLYIDATALPSDTVILVRVPRNLKDRTETLSKLSLVDQNSRWAVFKQTGGVNSSFYNFSLGTTEQASITLSIDFSYQAEHLHRYPIVVTQEQEGNIAGRLTLEIIAIKDAEDYFYANVHSKEIHTYQCIYRKRMRVYHQVPFATLQAGLLRGFDGCAFCLPDYSHK